MSKKKENKIIRFLEKNDPTGFKTGISIIAILLIIFIGFHSFNTKEKFNPDLHNCLNVESTDKENQDYCDKNQNDYKKCECIKRNYWYISNELGSFFLEEFFRKYDYPECILKKTTETKYNINYSYTNFTNTPCFQFYSKDKALQDFTIRFSDYTHSNIYIRQDKCLKAVPK